MMGCGGLSRNKAEILAQGGHQILYNHQKSSYENTLRLWWVCVLTLCHRCCVQTPEWILGVTSPSIC